MVLIISTKSKDNSDNISISFCVNHSFSVSFSLSETKDNNLNFDLYFCKSSFNSLSSIASNQTNTISEIHPGKNVIFDKIC
ncbi:hypothetical protein HOG21_05420 [bacterium]|nr:hypothetical protein [bacterium]